ncbi:MAG: serine protease [Halodesulfovibrio sp.]
MRRCVLLLILLFLVGCKATMVGTNAESTTDVENKQVVGDQRVVFVSYDEAIDIAEEVASLKFRSVKVNKARNGIIVHTYDPMYGAFIGRIEPVVLYIPKTQEYGITFLMYGKGDGFWDGTLTPKTFLKAFYKELEDYLEFNDIENTVYTQAEYTQSKGVPVEKASASIPHDPQAFAFWLSKRADRDPMEGVYEDSAGEFTLGIYATPKDRQYKFKAVILESRDRKWKVGEILIKFKKLVPGSVCLSRIQDKQGTESGIAWKVERNSIVSLRKPHGDVALYRESDADLLGTGGATASQSEGPVMRVGDEEYRLISAGSVWVVGPKYLVTAEHVVDSDYDYFVFEGDEIRQVRVVATDKDLDLAVLKLMEGTFQAPPIPLRKQAKIPNGTPVLAMGFPELGTLGAEIKITAGLVNAQTGHTGKSQEYQISAEIHHGNSGGPVLDDCGNVMGVVSSGISKMIMDNVSFVVKYQFLKAFMESHNVDFTERESTKPLSAVEVFERYSKSVMLILATDKK